MEFPTGVLGVALGTILLPSLAKSYADKADGEYSQLLDWGLRLTFILALPAAVALAVLSVPLVTGLFHYGAFSALDVEMTRQALMAYSLGLLGLILVKVLAPAFYSRQNIKTPVKIALFTLASTQLMNLAFIGPFKHAGLALAIGLGACMNAGLLYFYLRKANVFKPEPGWYAFMFKLTVAVGAMAVVLHLVAGPDTLWMTYRVVT
jgi:putative peptidoglycan lipid II flippase